MKVKLVSNKEPLRRFRERGNKWIFFYSRFLCILTSARWNFPHDEVCILYSLIRILAWRKLVMWSAFFTASKLCVAASHRNQPRGSNGQQKLRREQDGSKGLLTRKTATKSMRISTCQQVFLNPNLNNCTVALLFISAMFCRSVCKVSFLSNLSFSS